MDLTEGVWRKALKSHEEGDACIELALLPHSTRGWRKASRSTAQADNCIEGAGAAVVAVRDSKDVGGPVLVLTRGEFRRFADAIKTA